MAINNTDSSQGTELRRLTLHPKQSDPRWKIWPRTKQISKFSNFFLHFCYFDVACAMPIKIVTIYTLHDATWARTTGANHGDRIGHFLCPKMEIWGMKKREKELRVPKCETGTAPKLAFARVIAGMSMNDVGTRMVQIGIFQRYSSSLSLSLSLVMFECSNSTTLMPIASVGQIEYYA